MGLIGVRNVMIRMCRLELTLFCMIVLYYCNTEGLCYLAMYATEL